MGSKIDQKSIQKGIEKTMEKRRAPEQQKWRRRTPSWWPGADYDRGKTAVRSRCGGGRAAATPKDFPDIKDIKDKDRLRHKRKERKYM